MALGTGVSGWPCADVNDSMCYSVTLGTSVSEWPCAETGGSVYC